MKRFLGVALPALAVTPVMAADLPVKAPPALSTTAPADWTGYYLGLNAGYAWGQNSTNCSFVPGINTACQGIGFPNLKTQGGLFGAEVGENWQIHSWVVGIAADWSAADVHGSEYFPSVDAGKSNQLASRYDWLGTARGRVGYAVGQSLFYGTGGLAVGRVKDTYDNEINGMPPEPATFMSSGTRVGWTAGAGWEYKMSQHWNFKVEYLHVDLGSSSLDISGAITNAQLAGLAPNPPGSAVLHFNNAFDIVRAGVGFSW